MSEFSWRWPLALAVGALLVVAVILVVLRHSRRERLRTDILKALRPKGDNKTGKDDKTGQPGETARPASRHPLVWGLRPALTASRPTGALGGRYRSYKLACLAGVSLLALSLLTCLGLVGRPGTVRAAQSPLPSRDIVLCLDVSGSALPYDRQIIATYLQLVKGFTSERIGMSIFNSTSRTVFPLTDDYSLVTAQLRDALTILGKVQTQQSIDRMSDAQYQKVADWLAGTQNRKDATSLIGDGLVSCAAMLPQFSVDPTGSPGRRSVPASILFATDNVLSGSPAYSLQAALDLAAQNHIRVDALFTGAPQSVGEPTAVDMRTRVQAGGGLFLTPGGDGQNDQVNQLVQSIEAEKTHALGDETGLDRTDDPAPWVGLLLILIAAYCLVMSGVRR